MEKLAIRLITTYNLVINHVIDRENLLNKKIDFLEITIDYREK